MQYIGGHIVPSKGGNVVQEHVLMVANVDGQDTEYFSAMLENYRTRYKRHRNSSQSRELVMDITSQLARTFDIDPKIIPEPSKVLFQQWHQKMGGTGWHIWEKGVNWSKSLLRMLKPLKFEEIYMVGSTYCGGQCALWMEGAMQTVDEVLNWYFGVR